MVVFQKAVVYIQSRVNPVLERGIIGIPANEVTTLHLEEHAGDLTS
jgi:hypothetical protein